MAKKDSDKGVNRFAYIAGTAAVTAFAVYFVNRHLKERDELKMLRFAEEQKKLSGGGDK